MQNKTTSNRRESTSPNLKPILDKPPRDLQDAVRMELLAASKRNGGMIIEQIAATLGVGRWAIYKRIERPGYQWSQQDIEDIIDATGGAVLIMYIEHRAMLAGMVPSVTDQQLAKDAEVNMQKSTALTSELLAALVDDRSPGELDLKEVNALRSHLRESVTEIHKFLQDLDARYLELSNREATEL